MNYAVFVAATVLCGFLMWIIYADSVGRKEQMNEAKTACGIIDMKLYSEASYSRLHLRCVDADGRLYVVPGGRT
jgi:hypothetical protein